jgi:hypothetical protein
MPEKLKSKINALFVQLNRYTRQRKDFKSENFLRDLSSYFDNVDRVDLSGGGGRKVDEQLKLRMNTVTRNAEPLVRGVADLMVLYFWYLRRPGSDSSGALVAAKKMRGQVDDSYFIENELAPLIFGGKLKGFGKREYQLRDLLLRKAAMVATHFKESDQLPASATKLVRTDSWQKKMLHLSALHQAGRDSEIPRVAPREELHQISSQNRFAAWYLRTNSIYQPENRFLMALKRFFRNLGSFVLIPFNLRFVFHVLKNRLPVYLVYLVIVAAFVFGAIEMKAVWQKVFNGHLETLPTLTQQQQGGGGG